MSELDPEFGAVMTIGGHYYSRYAPNKEVKTFWSGAERSELLIKECKRCGAKIHPARLCCPRCLSTPLAWTRSSGKGEVYTYTVIHYPYIPELKDKVPYVLALVRLDEGVVFYTTMVNCGIDDVRIGMRVEVVFDDDNLFHRKLPKFQPLAP